MKILVTGSLGFIMSGFVRSALSGSASKGVRIRGVARSTNQKHLKRIPESFRDSRFELIYTDLASEAGGLCDGVDLVIHGAARTFVDRSIKDPAPFTKNNVDSTLNILEDARKYGVKKFIMCSTDEVLGSIRNGAHREDAAPNPSNPYAASKLACEGLCQSYAKTYGLNTLILRFENVYGPYQGSEKVIPTFCRSLMNGDKCPVYGKGDHVRQWLHLDDCIAGIMNLAKHATEPGEIFHVAGNRCLTNAELAKMIIASFGLSPVEDFIRFIDDTKIRPGHDFRYALCTDKIKATGWSAQVELDRGIPEAAEWYRNNQEWAM